VEPTITTEKRHGIGAERPPASRTFYRQDKPQGLEIEPENFVCHIDAAHDEVLGSGRHARETLLREYAGAVKVVAPQMVVIYEDVPRNEERQMVRYGQA
jgi:hypothetical protein